MPAVVCLSCKHCRNKQKVMKFQSDADVQIHFEKLQQSMDESGDCRQDAMGPWSSRQKVWPEYATGRVSLRLGAPHPTCISMYNLAVRS